LEEKCPSQKTRGLLFKTEYILLIVINFKKIPIQSDGHGFDRVLLEICPPAPGGHMKRQGVSI
jgi:hypothetical protein